MPNEIILNRFGEVDLLFENKKYGDIELDTAYKKFSNSIKFPEIEDIEGIKFED